VGRASAPSSCSTTAIVAVTGAPALAATVTRVPVDAGTAGGIGGVDAVSTKDGWAVGSTGTDAVIRRFDGTRWRVVPSPSLADPSAPSGGTGLSRCGRCGHCVREHRVRRRHGPNANTAWRWGSQSDQTTGQFAPLAFRVTA
jgi:hypothetical protein